MFLILQIQGAEKRPILKIVGMRLRYGRDAVSHVLRHNNLLLVFSEKRHVASNSKEKQVLF